MSKLSSLMKWLDEKAQATIREYFKDRGTEVEGISEFMLFTAFGVSLVSGLIMWWLIIALFLRAPWQLPLVLFLFSLFILFVFLFAWRYLDKCMEI